MGNKGPLVGLGTNRKRVVATIWRLHIFLSLENTVLLEAFISCLLGSSDNDIPWFKRVRTVSFDIFWKEHATSCFSFSKPLSLQISNYCWQQLSGRNYFERELRLIRSPGAPPFYLPLILRTVPFSLRCTFLWNTWTMWSTMTVHMESHSTHFQWSTNR